MTDEEFYRIKFRVDAGESVRSACDGNGALRVAYIRRINQQDTYNNNNKPDMPVELKIKKREKEIVEFSDEEYSQVVPNWKKLPKITQQLWKTNIDMSFRPDANPQSAIIHSKTMVALCPEFREKKERQNFTPEDYRAMWEEAFSNTRKDIIRYAERKKV